MGLLRCYFTLTIGDIISHAGKQAQTGIRIPFRNAGGQGNTHRMSPAGKTLSICTLNLINPPDNSTGLVLFNGGPRGAFLAQSILWRSGDPVTGCVHDLVFEMWKPEKMGNTRGFVHSRPYSPGNRTEDRYPPGRRHHLPGSHIPPNRAPFYSWKYW